MKSHSATYRVFSLTMAFLLFFTSVGFSVDMHYCNGELKSSNLFGKAKSCHEIGQGMKNCPHHKKMLEAKKANDTKLSKKGCCSNQTVHFQFDQDQQQEVHSSVVFNKQLQYFVIALVDTFLNTGTQISEKSVYAQYKPPLVPRDIYVLLETFRL